MFVSIGNIYIGMAELSTIYKKSKKMDNKNEWPKAGGPGYG
jgi:hypothetical protein